MIVSICVEFYFKTLIGSGDTAQSLNLSEFIELISVEVLNPNSEALMLFSFVNYTPSSGSSSNDFSTQTGKNSWTKTATYTRNDSQFINHFRSSGTYKFYCTIYLEPGHSFSDLRINLYANYYGGYIKCRGTNKVWA